MTRLLWINVCITVGALFVLASSAAAQRAVEPVPIQSFRLVDWGGKLFMESEYRDDRDSRPNRSDTTQRDLYLESGIELTGRGYIYHPNLVDWSALLRFGYTRQDISVNGDDRNSQGTLIGYNINTAILRTKLVGFRVFGSMTDQYINRTFSQPLDSNRRNEGFEVIARTPISMNLLVEHTSSTEESSNRRETEETYLARFTARDHRDTRRITELVFEHEDADQELSFQSGGPTSVIALPLVRDDLTITNAWRFGSEDLPHTLDGTLRAQQQSGFIDSEFYFLTQRLTLQHSPTLSSFYIGRLQHASTQEQTEDSGYAEIGVRKSIYDSLILTGRAYGSMRTFNEGDETIYGGSFEADYRKKTPIGLYRSNLRVSREHESEQFEDGTLRILDEPITLNGVGRERLTQANVIVGTVNVTDATNTFTYVQGADYILSRIGSFTEIRRVAGGNIADGETVLVDYTIDQSEDAAFHNDRLEWRHRIELNDIPVALYSRLRIDRDTLDDGTDPGDLEQEFRLMVGGELTLGPALLSAEYEWATFDLTPPFSAYRARATYVSSLGRDMTLNGGAHYEMTQYRDVESFGLADEEDFLETYGGFATLVAKPRSDLLVRVDARIEQTRGRDDSLLARIGPSLSWKRGLTEVDINAYHEFYQQDDSSGTTQSIELRVTRRF